MRKVQIIILIIALALFICGLLVIFNSPSMGLDAANKYVQNRGGSIDASKYDVLLASTLNSYRTGGLVMAMVGGLGTVLYSFLVFSRKDK